MSQPQPPRTPHRIPVWQMEPGWRFLHPLSPDVFTVETIEEDEYGRWIVYTREGLPVEFWARADAEVFLPGYLL
jgi:hypothetical protein